MIIQKNKICYYFEIRQKLRYCFLTNLWWRI